MFINTDHGDSFYLLVEGQCTSTANAMQRDTDIISHAELYWRLRIRPWPDITLCSLLCGHPKLGDGRRG